MTSLICIEQCIYVLVYKFCVWASACAHPYHRLYHVFDECQVSGIVTVLCALHIITIVFSAVLFFIGAKYTFMANIDMVSDKFSLTLFIVIFCASTIDIARRGPLPYRAIAI